MYRRLSALHGASRHSAGARPVTAVIVITALALVAVVAALACLAIVIVGIHGEERAKTLTGAPRTWRRSLARKVLGYHATPASPAPRSHAGSRR